jgi:valyl-tRNA synthetase
VYTASRADARPYTIAIPPPNVTGALHIGHALDNTLQDVLVRTKRMQGYDALYVPGTDHAGISTQAKVEAALRAQGIHRHDLGREAFVERVWQWKEEYVARIHTQWEMLGLSLDMSRERFTLDEGLSHAVRTVFVSLFEQGLIYRGEYIIHWDPIAQTAISDMEVEHIEVEGALYHIAYRLADGDGAIVVATTRPETLLGDVAVAVHPEDPRYASWIGAHVVLPVTGRHIPIVADDAVDRSFGTGAVKITPAHDAFDFALAQRHGLPSLCIMHRDGTMNAHAAPYTGLDRFVCRTRIVDDVRAAGLLVDVQKHVHAVGHSERSGAVVEPMQSVQWFVRMQPLVDAARETPVRFVPERFGETYARWMDGMRDWCISRQLWWGHRIPAWHCAQCGHVTVSKDDPDVCAHCHSDQITQDEDVLDTWFSSALWPFSTLGWPHNTADMQRYYPTDVLVTGYDIIFFWVARMMTMGAVCTGRAPFGTVLVHGLVRDAEGRKMSKSLGNGIDPIAIISEYGADALRFMLVTTTTPGQDVRFRIERVSLARAFANKLWNATRFMCMHVQDVPKASDPSTWSTADRWIMHRLTETIAAITERIEAYDFGEMGRALTDFIWDDVCDWYIECAKITLTGDDPHAIARTKDVLYTVMRAAIQLMHPLMPFVTEELWHQLPGTTGSISVSAWPQADVRDAAAHDKMTRMIAIVRAVRTWRAEQNVAPSKKISLHIRPHTTEIAQDVHSDAQLIARFAYASSLTIGDDVPQGIVTTLVVGGADLTIPHIMDVAQEKARLQADIARLREEVARIDRKLDQPDFVARAPEAIVTKERNKRAEYASMLAIVCEKLEALDGTDA